MLFSKHVTFNCRSVVVDMGVVKLWPILEDTGRPVKLHELQGQKVAIDLNGWILSSTKISNSYGRKWQGQKLYLQNLFWRCYCLLRHDIVPVFVIDGMKSPLKNKSNVDRSKIPAVSECKKLLDCLGLQWITSSGEAEALCAKLDQNGIVNGCITDDGDAFLYGANTVYRNFSCNKDKMKEMRVFDRNLLKSKLGLDRERLIALALFLGCDYVKGVSNVGPKVATQLLSKIPSEKNVLEHLQSWRTDPENKFAELEELEHLSKPQHCSKCNHEGNLTSHNAKGCKRCGTEKACNNNNEACDCDYHLDCNFLKRHALELRVRQWALQQPTFPSQEVINEYLNPKCEPVEEIEKITWKRPNWFLLQKYLEQKLHFQMTSAKQKVQELSISWSLGNDDAPPKLVKVLKSKMQNGIALFEVLWENEGVEPFKTLESQKTIENVFPKAVEDFESKKKKGKKRSCDFEEVQICKKFKLNFVQSQK